jgi:hypothetical protein
MNFTIIHIHTIKLNKKAIHKYNFYYLEIIISLIEN